jgi:hypothetical protein
MSIASIQSKYPSAIWFDSAHTGTESGTVDEPYNTIAEAMTAASDGGVIAIKDGTHNTGQISLGKNLTFVGESMDGAILSSSLRNFYSATYTLNLETLKVLNTSLSSRTGIIYTTGALNVDSCIIDQGSEASVGRGLVTGASSSRVAYVFNSSILKLGSSSATYGIICGGGAAQMGCNSLTLNGCTIINTAGSGDGLAQNASIVAGVFKNSIYVGLNSDDLGTYTPTANSNNCFHNTSFSSGSPASGSDHVYADPQFVDASNGDFRLRPSSPCIGTGTTS